MIPITYETALVMGQVFLGVVFHGIGIVETADPDGRGMLFIVLSGLLFALAVGTMLYP